MNKTREKDILLEVCNNCTLDSINRYLNPRKTVDNVEGYVIVAAVFMIFLAAVSPMRRHSQSIIIRYGVRGVFTLSFPLISYTMGLMQADKIKNELYPVWAMFLAMLFGGTNAMSVQSLDQNKQLMKLCCDCFLFALYLGMVLAVFSDTLGKEPVPYIGCMLMVIYLLSFTTLERWRAAILASKPSSKNGIKWLAHYIKQEHQLSTSYDPRTMQGYKYFVLIHKGRGGTRRSTVTLEEIWSDNVGVLSSSSSSHIHRLKDLCLSFTLFHLVVQRYFGYRFSESGLEKTRDLVIDGLLQTEQGYERAFQVIEAELAFLYDFFFTKFAYIMYVNEMGYCGLSLALTFFSIFFGAWSLSVLNTHGSILESHLVETSTRDVLVTKIVLGALSIFQLLQIWSYCVSDWAKVSFVCKYATHPSWQENDLINKLLLLVGRPHKWLRYWSNNLGQYSVLDSFSSSYWGRFKHRLQSGKASKPIDLPIEVKRAVARTIKNSANGHLSNGTSAVMRHGMSDELCWACEIDEEFTVIHSILVWHVATSFCEISETIKHRDENDVHPNQFVATILSKYCTYLVAFAPALLPGSAGEAECTLDELVKEVEATLQGLVTPREKYEKLREVDNVADAVPPNVVDATAGEATSAELLRKGVMLGKALESMENHTARWDLLSDFWTEMVVYIAPSDNVACHIKHLAEGGEFVTHVWALLMHAGVLERPAAAGAALP